jgi:hypothetical protein
MEPFSEIKIHKMENCYKLSCVIHKTPLTHFKWLGFIDEISQTIVQMGNDPNINKYYMFFDLTNLNPIMNNSYYSDIFNVFYDNYNLFIDKLLGTFIYMDNQAVKLLMNVFLKLYTPVRPLFFLNHPEIDQNIVKDLLNGIKNKDEFKV